MDKITTNSLNELIALFEERDEVYSEYTGAIAEMLEHTVLAAIQELFAVNSDQLEVADIALSVEDLSLQIACTVTYSAGDSIPQFVEIISPAELDAAGNQTHGVRIGIPIAHCAAPKDEILLFLQELLAIHQSGETIPESTPAARLQSQQFDMSKLSKDQITHMLVLQHQTTGVKH